MRPHDAFRRAGAAVAAAVLGFPVPSIVADAPHILDDSRPHDVAVVDVAGVVAESIRFPGRFGVESRIYRARRTSARVAFASARGRFKYFMVDADEDPLPVECLAVERSARLMRERWPAVRAVAARLARGERLSAVDVERIIEPR